MNKQQVLEIFSRNTNCTPDGIRTLLSGFHFRSSVYSYLFRLHKQGLLNRARIAGRIVYSISERGIERLNYLKSQGREAGKKH